MPRMGFGGRIEEREGRALRPLLVTGPSVVRRTGAIELRGIANRNGAGAGTNELPDKMNEVCERKNRCRSVEEKEEEYRWRSEMTMAGGRSQDCFKMLSTCF